MDRRLHFNQTTRKRVLEVVDVEAPAGKFECAKVEWQVETDIEFFDYISVDGLTKKTIVAKDITLTSVNGPAGIGLTVDVINKFALRNSILKIKCTMTPADFYNGFWIAEPVGNNAFSFEQRKNQTIYVPPILPGAVDNLTCSDKIVFSEIEEGQEHNHFGLENFIYFEFAGKPVFIFDNHNHAFFFWLYGLKQNLLTKGGLLIHVDQHTDLRDPENFHELPDNKIDLRQAFEYTNFVLNVGNFIKPALKLRLFSQVEIIDSQTSFEKEFSPGFALDLDMDIFSDDMNYIDEDFKKQRIKKYIAGASFITVATSPYFMPQEKAIKILRELFE